MHRVTMLGFESATEVSEAPWFAYDEMASNDSLTESGDWNATGSNWTITSFVDNDTTLGWWTKVIYPSGYTPLSLLIASVFVTFIMIMIVGGNIMVIIAIATERSLKGIQNWFIGSLAVADCLLGLIIMPFSLANEMMGYWVFGQWWCDVHSAVDVLLCTSSIMNLCLISLDRYWSITHAIEYLRKRTPERVIIMIATVWVLSGLISIPPLLGWKKDTPKGEFPRCELSEDIGYVLYSALGSFYIPSCIMVFVYIRIYFAARARSRRAQENKIKRRQSHHVKQEEQLKLQNEQQKQQQQQRRQLDSSIEMAVRKTTVAIDVSKENSQQQTTPVANGKSILKGNHHQTNQSTTEDIGREKTAKSNYNGRRYSLSGELSHMKSSPGLLGVPSISMDRIGKKPPAHGGDLNRSTAPSSMLAIDEPSPTGRPSLLNHNRGGTGRSKPCVTFQCRSIENVTYTTVRVSIDDDYGDDHDEHPYENEEHDENELANVKKTVEMATETTIVSVVRPSSIFPSSRKRFQLLAKRLVGVNVEASTSPVVHTQLAVAEPVESTAANCSNHPCTQLASENNQLAVPSPPCSFNETSAVQNDETTMGLEGEMDVDPSSSDSGNVSRCTVVRPLKIRFCRPGSGSVKKSSKAKRQVIDTGRVVVRETDPARERRRINRQREKRATLILGLIMGAFIACWLPFFFLYLLAPVCPSCDIQPWGFAFAFWLGYINSALNPVIYTIFNKDFRRAFRRMLFRCTIAHY